MCQWLKAQNTEICFSFKINCRTLCGSQILDKLNPNVQYAAINAAVFSATGASKKLLIGENLLYKQIFKGTWVVLAGIECSQKFFEFLRAEFPSKGVST